MLPQVRFLQLQSFCGRIYQIQLCKTFILAVNAIPTIALFLEYMILPEQLDRAEIVNLKLFAEKLLFTGWQYGKRKLHRKKGLRI